MNFYLAPTCPGDLVYDRCHSACPRQCNMTEPGICAPVCNPGCECPHGLYRSEDRCYEKEDCPKQGNNSKVSKLSMIITLTISFRTLTFYFSNHIFQAHVVENQVIDARMECVSVEAENRVQVPQTLVSMANVFVGVAHPAVCPLAIVVKEVDVFAE